jgi:hypothetical protein
MKKIFFVSLCVAAWCWSAKPMESIENYNVILVHGAADMRSGLDCRNGKALENAYQTIQTVVKKEDGKDSIIINYQARIGGYEDWVLPWNENFHGGFLFQDTASGATGMLKELRPWLKDYVFGGNDTVIYLQRPFVNPAGSPFDNGDEIGKSGWHGDDKCSERRSLIEEAQEVRAEGRVNLINLRKDVTLRDNLPPSRNILIAHSMGGVSSREYVQGNGYKNDVDKVITLDSPHEGTGQC